MTRRRIALTTLAALAVLVPTGLVVLDRALPPARPPQDAGPNVMKAAKAVCGSPPWGRVGRLEWDTESPGVRVTCTWKLPRGVGWETVLSCAEGSWNGPIGWTNWGALAPCVSRPNPPSAAR